MNANQLEDRLIDFGVRITYLCRGLPTKDFLTPNMLRGNFFEQEPMLDFIIRRREQQSQHRISNIN